MPSLIGLAFALLAVSVLSRFILTVEVVGSEEVPTAQILSELRRYGGASGGVRPRPGPQDHRPAGPAGAGGAVLDVHQPVRDPAGGCGPGCGEPPELAGEDGYYDIVAGDGRADHPGGAHGGRGRGAGGDTVAEGEVLISGVITMEPPKYSDLPVRTYQTHARGKVYARTWRTLSAAIPVQAGGEAAHRGGSVPCGP